MDVDSYPGELTGRRGDGRRGRLAAGARAGNSKDGKHKGKTHTGSYSHGNRLNPNAAAKAFVTDRLILIDIRLPPPQS